jgi:putative drug exporter of the RND superfamily
MPMLARTVTRVWASLTGGIVTAAASLMVIVFLGFATSELLPIKQVGIGLALAVLLDATVSAPCSSRPRCGS